MANTIQVIGCAAAALLLLGLPLLLLQRQQNVEHELHKQTPAAAAAKTTPTTAVLSTASARQQLLQLHRQKRYLLFPEGSSFQMVFDLIIPIVDYTNFAIMGITCAVAWELPSKPASELIENVRTRLNDGTLGVVRRNDSVATTAATNWHALHAYPNQQQTKAAALPYDGYYRNVAKPAASYANAYAQQQRQRQRQPAMLTGAIANWQPPAARYQQRYSNNNNWWQHNKERIEQHWRQKQRLGEAYAWQHSSSAATARKLLQAAPQHRIYPVFGKRRRRQRQRRHMDEATDLQFEQLHLRSHLTTRQLLFRKIELLYQAQQLNGTACVLRALCESAQRQRLTTRPQSFIMELLSAIFQLPMDDEQELAEARQHISPHYLEAHQQLGSCRQLYSDCRHGFWLD